MGMPKSDMGRMWVARIRLGGYGGGMGASRTAQLLRQEYDELRDVGFTHDETMALMLAMLGKR